MPLKILFLLEDLCYGGTQRQNLELALRLDREKFTPHMLTLTGPTDLDGLALDGGIVLSHLCAGRKAAPLFFARLPFALSSVRPDLIVACTALPNIWGRIWGKALGIPVVGSCRGGGAPARQHEFLLWRAADHIVCNSRELVARMRSLGAPEDRLTYIPNGVDTVRFSPGETPPEKRAPLVVCVARLAKDKDHRTLIGAFALLARKRPDARLRLVGEGPEEATLRAFVSGLPREISDRVEFAGAGGNMLPHYREAALFALSSVREGQPNVLLEAMACGLPVCATSVGGIPGLIGADGLLSAPGDQAALAENMLRLLDDSSLAAGLGRAGRQKAVREHSFEAMVGAHENIFMKLAGAGKLQ